ncbi:MAG: hypothetical protein ACTS89_01700, partial [Arsenophonus sp. ER-LPS3-MAG3]
LVLLLIELINNISLNLTTLASTNPLTREVIGVNKSIFFIFGSRGTISKDVDVINCSFVLSGFNIITGTIFFLYIDEQPVNISTIIIN